MQAVLQRKEEEDRQTRELVQGLQTALDSEKLLVHGLRGQVCALVPHSALRLRAPLLPVWSFCKLSMRALGTAVPFQEFSESKSVITALGAVAGWKQEGFDETSAVVRAALLTRIVLGEMSCVKC